MKAEEAGFEGEWRAVKGSRYFEAFDLYKENGFKERRKAEENDRIMIRDLFVINITALLKSLMTLHSKNILRQRSKKKAFFPAFECWNPKGI